MKTIKKIACTLIAALLVLATGVTGLSRGFTSSAEGSCSITIKNASVGKTYSAYKIFDVTVSESGSAYSYKVDSNWTTFISGYKYCTGECTCASDGNPCCKQYEQCQCESDEDCTCCVNLFTLQGNDTDGYLLSSTSAVFNCEQDSEVMKNFATAAKAYAEKNNIPTSGTATGSDEDGDVTAIISDLDAGWYLVTGTTNDVICILDTVTGSEEINDKIPTPTIDKSILTTDESGNSAAVDEDTDANADYVKYQIILSGIYGATNLVLHDALPDGLTLVTEDDTHSITVTVYSKSTTNEESGSVTPSGTSETKEKDANYTVNSDEACLKSKDTSNPVSKCNFEIYFGTTGESGTDMDLTTGLTESAVIVITYWCKVDSTKGKYIDDVESLVNVAGASYGDSSWTITDTAEVDVFEFEILKTDDSGTPLEGAQFTLQKNSNSSGEYASFTTGNDGEYVFSKWVGEKDDTTTLVSDSTGKIVVQGMDAGEYTLTEVAAPDGYNLLTSPITVEISYTYSDGIWSYTLNKSGDTASEHKITVVNNTGKILPNTGGIGTTIFYIVGGVIIIVAVVLLVTRRRVGAKDDK